MTQESIIVWSSYLCEIIFAGYYFREFLEIRFFTRIYFREFLQSAKRKKRDNFARINSREHLSLYGIDDLSSSALGLYIDILYVSSPHVHLW